MGSVSSTIRKPADAADLAPFWRSLEGPGSAPMQQHSWSQACWETLPIDGELNLVVVTTTSATGAIAPLVARSGRLHRLEHLGVRQILEPADFAYSDPAALEELASTLAGSGSPLLLERLPADSPTVRAIQEAYRGRGVVSLRPGNAFPRIVLDEAWREPERQLNSGRRSDLRRAVRNAEKIGPLQYQILTPKPDELGPLLDEAFEIEAANWKGREGTAMARDALRSAFYRRYAAAASRDGTLRLCFLRVGDRAVAMQYAVQCGGSFWLLKIGYREEFSRCSPGMLLIAETIRYAAAQQLSSYEFLGSAESWTRVWTTDERASLIVRAYPASVRGMAALAVDGAGVASRRVGRIARGGK